MVWMESFCFCCSVRLGVVVCGTISFIHAIISWSILVIFGLPILNSAKYFITREEQFSEDMLLWKMMEVLSNNSEIYMGTFQCLIGSHTVGSLLAIYGALRLRKWFLIPYAISQTLMAIAGVSQHVVCMMVLKNIIGLELLIGITLMGAFFLLFLAYSVTTAVTMFQIIILINSQEYKALYGDDPFAPRINLEARRQMGRDVEIFFIPHKKEASRAQEMISKKREKQAVISVRSLDEMVEEGEEDDVQNIDFNNWHVNEVVCVGKGLK